MSSVRVLSRRCGTCIFNPGNLMHLREGRLRALVEDCRSRDAHVPCHEFLTLPRGGWVAGEQARGAVCRGYWETQPHSWPLRWAEGLGLIVWVDPRRLDEQPSPRSTYPGTSGEEPEHDQQQGGGQRR